YRLSPLLTKLPLIAIVAPARLVLSVSSAAAPLISETGVLFNEAGLLMLSVNVGFALVAVSVGALSIASPSVRCMMLVIVRSTNNVGDCAVDPPLNAPSYIEG